MAAATICGKRLALMFAALSCMTSVDAGTRKTAIFKSIDGSWVLKIRGGEGHFIERDAPQIWRGSVGRVGEGREIKSAFVWAYVVAGEADYQVRALSMNFAKKHCRGNEGRSYPFSVTLHFEGSPPQRGCGKRLP